MKVKLLIGQYAYACIEHEGQKTDIRLFPGKSPQASLREYAAEQHARATRILEMVDLANAAAEHLESKP